MTPQEAAIAQLDAMLPALEPEPNHERADELLLGLVPPDVAAAYRRADERVTFWHSR